MTPSERKIKIVRDGPYIVSGKIPLLKTTIVCDESGESVEWLEKPLPEDRPTYSLCRCGASKNKPYCDGTHSAIGFDGTETASREPYAERAKRLEGPDLLVTDVPELCSEARFCAACGKLWHVVYETEDPRKRQQAVQQAQFCPSGRYVACDKATGEPIEMPREPSIGVVEDPQMNVSGGLWVRGGIPVQSADGSTYEVRERVTLCRCGASSNKPFCDSSHHAIHFSDEG